MSAERAKSAPDGHADLLGLATGLLVFAPVALVSNEVDALLRYPEIGAAVLFTPYAALTTALVFAPRRQWGWYILVGALAHFVAHWPHWPFSWVLLADVSNVTRALVATALLRLAFKGPPRLDSVAALARFVLSAVLVAPAVGATIGAENVMLHHASPTYWSAWSVWFMSSALTGLTILPCFILGVAAALKWRPHAVDARRVAEGAALLVAFLITSAIAFRVHSDNRWQLALLFYAPLPVLIWTALRFGTATACAALSGLTIAAVWSADRGAGAFRAFARDEDILILQVFVVLTALPVLCIGAVSGARHAVVQLHRALLASLHDAIAILDSRGVVVEVNESWRRFAEASHGPPFHRARVGDSYALLCEKSAEGGDTTGVRARSGVTSVLNRDVGRFEMEYDDHSGTRSSRYALSVEPLERPDGGAVVVRADVTARRFAQVEIEEQRRELSHLARVASLGQLSGAFAHELNQPLASISNNAEAARYLLKRRPVDLVELDAILKDIVGADQRAALVIRRLRAMLKRGETRIQAVDAAELVDEVLELAHAELITRRIAVAALVAPDLPSVLADRIQLQQVLLNLILNAAEAMRSTPEADRRVSLIVRSDDGSNLHFSVRDHGPGISPSLIDHLFEPFVTTKPEGLGLGLSISRAIIAAHGGRLWAENNADQGATVHCLVPSNVTNVTPAERARPVRAGALPAVGGATVRV